MPEFPIETVNAIANTLTAGFLAYTANELKLAKVERKRRMEEDRKRPRR